ncbi:MAG: tRNA glutamyl-Q(34) synthetase GluQRS [Planctomycetota bacterium]
MNEPDTIAFEPTVEFGGPVTGRLAPSPTGRLHLGHARSFVAAWWHARAAGGRVVLRSEDLDRTRCKPEYEDAFLRDLEWLGLTWDGPLLRQSDDLEPYERATEQLLAGGHAYACTCTRKDILAAQSAPHTSGEELRYPGTCRGRWADVATAEATAGTPAGVRFDVGEARVAYPDELAGAQLHHPQAECGDFLLLRRDGVISYQLAVVVDDARQGVTEVLRGSDLLPSAARQMLLQRDLGLALPRQLHVGLVRDPEGRRLSKRDGDLELAELRERGVPPARLITWAARSLGAPPDWSGEAQDLAATPCPALRPGDARLDPGTLLD